MSETLRTNNHEQDSRPEDLEAAGAERSKELQNERERSAEKAHEKDAIDEKRHEALETAAKAEKETTEAAVSPAEKRRDTPAKKAVSPDESFKSQMTEARRSMSVTSRSFSKVIHNKAVEKTSDAVGNTVARPNAILFGSLFALIITAGVYFWAKHVGYQLSGFETIGAFIIGWIIGIIVDFTRIMVTGKTS